MVVPPEAEVGHHHQPLSSPLTRRIEKLIHRNGGLSLQVNPLEAELKQKSSPPGGAGRPG